MESKKNFRKFMLILLTVFCSIGMIVVILDPFYQYHAPWMGIPIILENAVYQTPGAARNLDYTDAIVGTSMTENFHTDWFDKELGWKTIKLSYSGARSNDLNAIFSSIFSREETVNHIFMDINDYQLTEVSWTAYVVRPEYLYDEHLLNDYRYILNRDVIVKGCERVLDGLQGVEDNIDSAYSWEADEYFGTEQTLDTVRDNRAQLLEQTSVQKPLEQRLLTCQENLDNILPFIEQNSDTEFIVFFPPYSMLYWEQLVLMDDLSDKLAIYSYAIEQFLQYDNVSVYYFQNEEDIITNLDNHRDECHHRPEINRYIFECIKEDKNRVTMENLKETIQNMYEFARDYNYDIYWQ